MGCVQCGHGGDQVCGEHGCHLYPFSDSYSATQALMSLFVLSSKDGWVNIMYDGLDAVGIDQQVCRAGAMLTGDLEQFLHVFGIGASRLRNLPQNL